MKNIKTFNQLFELSNELINRVSDKMIAKGQINRANDLKKPKNKKSISIYDEFIGKILFQGVYTLSELPESVTELKGYEISNIERKELKGNETLEIDLIDKDDSSSVPETDKLCYDILNDKYLNFWRYISRKDARLLGKIAAKVNPNTQYIRGTGDFRIRNY
jgi:hypothetical protein